MRVDILYDRPISPNFAAGEGGTMAAFPQAALLAGGRVACVYRRGTTKHSHDGVFVLQTSDDLGLTWSEPRVIYNGLGARPAQTVVSGGICQTPAGALLATFSTVEGLQPGEYMFSAAGMALPRWVFVTRSADGGQTWMPAQKLDTAAFPTVGITTKPFALPNGEIFAPVEVGTRLGVQSTAAAISSDDGCSFGPLITCADDATGTLSLCDARFTALPDGRLLMLLWTFRKDNEETIHVRRSYSSDYGRTWTSPAATTILSQITVPLALPSGAVIAVGNFRLPPQGSRLWYSTDAGATWDADHPIQMWDALEERIVGRPIDPRPLDADKGRLWEALGGFTFGTPDLVLLPDGSVLLTYYATVKGIVGARACRFRVVE